MVRLASLKWYHYLLLYPLKINNRYTNFNWFLSNAASTQTFSVILYPFFNNLLLHNVYINFSLSTIKCLIVTFPYFLESVYTWYFFLLISHLVKTEILVCILLWNASTLFTNDKIDKNCNIGFVFIVWVCFHMLIILPT